MKERKTKGKGSFLRKFGQLLRTNQFDKTGDLFELT